MAHSVVLALLALVCAARAAGPGVRAAQHPAPHPAPVPATAAAPSPSWEDDIGDEASRFRRRAEEQEREDAEEENEEAHEFSPKDVTLGFGIFVTVFLFGLLVCCLQSGSVTMRMFTYSIFNNTLSIFCAVMTQQLFWHKSKHLLILVGISWVDSTWGSLLYSLCSAFFWHMVFLTVLNLIATWASREECPKDDIDNYMKATLFLAHVCSFAWIYFWGELNLEFMAIAYRNDFVNVSAIIFPFVAFLCNSLVLLLLKVTRWVAHWLHRSGSDEAAHLCVETNIEGNVEALCLATSFLLMQGVKFGVTQAWSERTDTARWAALHHLYNQDGEEGPWEFNHNLHEVAVLYALALGLWTSSVLYQWCRLRIKGESKVEDEKDSEDLWLHMSDVITSLLGMTSMWCFYFGTQWLTARIVLMLPFRHGVVANSLLLRLLVVATAVTFVALLLILMAAVASSCFRAMKGIWAQLDSVIHKCSMVMGVAVGISWEKAFSASVNALATSHTNPFPGATKVLLLGGVLVALLPIWVFYVLPMSTEGGYIYGFVPRIAEHRVRHDPEAVDLLRRLQLRLNQREQHSAEGDDGYHKLKGHGGTG